ncbi:nitronate monooxygenase [Metallumcola ferriviriculae]|uniref:Probable nitronate monooxygenase n=1 Tax=Metallumcola ferriviriculae TaxID=3039180 RepID=A0AAU0UMT1_9FIRM|nr:nitronate monooxygenase [Desulfitibacteraceae bacterium MK1]
MKIPHLTIGNITVPYPIIQGGMAVRISGGRLAGTVAKAGGVGVIAGTALTEAELLTEMEKAKNIANGTGAIGINVLFAVSNFADLIRTAMKNGIDMVFSGAGFSRDVFSWGREFNVPVVSIVSSGRLAKLAEKLGAAAVVVEGKEAGGHLGTDRPLKDILPEVVGQVKVPVIAAGGIITGKDIKWALDNGADGVQMGTRFAASEESDAPESFKQTYLDASKEDSILIESPVGLPGRALKTAFTERLDKGLIKPTVCNSCLKKCSNRFCLRLALEDAQKGLMQDGLIFAGEKVHTIKEILPVQKIFHNLISELRQD